MEKTGLTLEAARRLALIAPPLVLGSMALVFAALGTLLRPEQAWAAGFALYWVAWGICFPAWVLGTTGLREALRGPRPALLQTLLLLAPPLAVLLLRGLGFQQLTVGSLVLAVSFMIVNGFASELLWRGVFTTLFPDRWVLGVVYPALAFGAWHLVPALSGWVHPLLPAIVGGAVLLGLLYGWVARRTSTFTWGALSHALTDLAGVSTYVALVQPSG